MTNYKPAMVLLNYWIALIVCFEEPSWTHSQTWNMHSLLPRLSLKSRKKVWSSEQHFLSHEAGLYFIKNVTIIFLYLELEFLTPQLIIMDYYTSRFAKLETAAKSIGTAETGCKTSFQYFRFVSKYDHLRHAIIIRSSAMRLVISNPRLARPM